MLAGLLLQPASLPLTAGGKRGLPSALSLLAHGLLLALVLSGVLTPPSPPPIPQAMVVELVAASPPPQPVAPQVIPQPQSVPVPAAAPAVHRSSAPRPLKSAPAAPAPVTANADAAPPATPVVPAPAAPVAAPVAAPAFDARQYLPGIKERVQSHVVYPPLSLRRGEQGTITVIATLAADGSVADVRVPDETVSLRLREAAVRAVQDAAPFPTMVEQVKVTIPVVFQIR